MHWTNRASQVQPCPSHPTLHDLSTDKITTGILLIDSDIDQSFCFDMPASELGFQIGDSIVIITVVI